MGVGGRDLGEVVDLDLPQQLPGAVAESLLQRDRGGEERLGERPREQLRAPAGHRSVADGRVGPGLRDLAGDRELLRGGLDRQHLRRAALGPVLPHLVLHRVRVAVAADHQALRRAVGDLALRGHGRRLQQADQLGEGVVGAVVRGGRGEDQRVRVRREHVGELVVLRGLVRDVVGLVDHHRVPAVMAQVVDEAVLLEGVHRDDHLLEEGERVPGGGKLLLHLLNALGVQAHERDREAGPQLMLHLLQHMARADDEDPPAAAATDQLREDHADLESLAQAHRIRDQQARTDPLRVQGHLDGLALVREIIGEHLRGDGELGVVDRDRGLTQRRLDPETGAAVAGGGVGDDGRILGVLRRDRVESGVEGGGGVLDEVAHAADGVEGAVRGVLHGGDEPGLVTDGDQGAWGDHARLPLDQLRLHCAPPDGTAVVATFQHLSTIVLARVDTQRRTGKSRGHESGTTPRPRRVVHQRSVYASSERSTSLASLERPSGLEGRMVLVLIAYVDESYDQDTYFIGAAVAEEATWELVEQRFDAVRQRTASQHTVPVDAEFHGYELMAGRGDWSALRGKHHEAAGIYAAVLRASLDASVRYLFRGVDVRRLNAR